MTMIVFSSPGMKMLRGTMKMPKPKNSETGAMTSRIYVSLGSKRRRITKGQPWHPSLCVYSNSKALTRSEGVERINNKISSLLFSPMQCRIWIPELSSGPNTADQLPPPRCFCDSSSVSSSDEFQKTVLVQLLACLESSNSYVVFTKNADCEFCLPKSVLVSNFKLQHEHPFEEIYTTQEF